MQITSLKKTYVSHTKIKIPEETTSLFFKQLDLFKERIPIFSQKINHKLKSKIFCSSSAKGLEEKLKGKEIDLAITSPPYIKAIDYIYNQMSELFWIGDMFDLQTQSKQNEKKKQYIGTKHFHKKTSKIIIHSILLLELSFWIKTCKMFM